ncbi:chitin-binding type-2 domain-containing protein [Caerostris extrusa]|uniref:Chitin-binding type-2 domain-containing protein n=1 Tax=Caerostris extrusa TaxID=172846 RepID=A0AAV4UWL2_CAEEX|nr:chitin-binding type-2 domain-containing protein [Caerostris extrusa]
MTEMERQRIMNLFSTKMRPLNFWKRLQATTLTDDNRKDSPTSVTDPIRNEDFKLLASTNYLEFKNSEYSTTSLITTDVNIDPLTSSHVPDTISKPMDIMNVQNKKAAVDENEIFVSITIPTTTTIGIHSISENATSNSSQTDSNDNLVLTDLSFPNNSSFLKTSFKQHIENEMDLVDDTDSQTDNKLNELSIKVTPAPISSTPSQLTLNFNPISNKNSIATIGNGTHVSVSVTVRATAGISRLKWRRIPHGKKRKNLRLKNAPADMDFANNQDSYMDIILETSNEE